MGGTVEHPIPISPEEIPPEEVDRLLDRLANGIVRRRLAAPAILALEMGKPLNFLGSQVLIALDPFVRSIFRSMDYRKVALILEEDANVERLLVRIEEREAARQAEEGANAPAKRSGVRRLFDRLRRKERSGP